MENEYWFTKNDNLKYEFVKNNIENDDYYKYIRRQYNKEDADKDSIIKDILYCVDNIYNGYYSIYTIMDSIEEYARDNNAQDNSITEIIESADFMLKDF